MNRPLTVSPSAKVGITGVALFIVILVVGSFLGVFKLTRSKGTTLFFHFSSIRGLQPGNDVVLNGRAIGQVVSSDPAGDGGVKVRVSINPKNRIHENADVVITADSVFGGKILSIVEPLSAEREDDWNENRLVYRLPAARLTVGDEVTRVHQKVRTRIGVVAKVEPSRESAYDRVTLELTDGAILATDVVVPYVALDQPGAPTVAEVYGALAEGDYLRGSREPDITDLVPRIDETILIIQGMLREIQPQISQMTERLDGILVEVQTLLDEERVDALFDELQFQIANAGHQLDAVSGDIRGILNDTRPFMVGTMENLDRATGSLADTSEEVNRIVTDSEIRTTLEGLLTELEAASANLNKVMGDIQSVTGDEAVQSDLKGAVTAARSAVEQADQVLNRVNTVSHNLGGITFGGSVRERYLPELHRGYTDIELRATRPGQDRVHLGASAIGEGTQIELGYGQYLSPNLLVYGGLHRDKVGIGAEAELGPGRLIVDWYDANDPRFDLFGFYGLTPALDLMAGIEDFGDEEHGNLASFGVQYNF